MSVSERIPLDSSPKLFTAADLLEMPTDLPSGTVRYELDNGRLIVMTPPGNPHGAAQSNVVTELKIQGERRGYGRVRSEVGIVLWRDPDRVVGADVAFIATRSLPIRLTPEAWLETIPELVVEIRSKNDTLAYLERKALDYLKAGVQVVWVIDPIARAVTIHRPSAEPQTLHEGDTLTVEDIIPGFSLSVAEALRE